MISIGRGQCKSRGRGAKRGRSLITNIVLGPSNLSVNNASNGETKRSPQTASTSRVTRRGRGLINNIIIGPSNLSVNNAFNGQTNTSPQTSSTSRGAGRSRATGRSRGAGRGRGRVAVQNASEVEDYSQATSTNLPKMNFLKVAEYFQSLRSPELRQAKDSLSARADYGDNSVGYVRVKTSQSICTVQARLTPQTSVNKKAYTVFVSIDENSKAIVNPSCDCQSSEGECKHQTALIFWLLRRSEEPAPTEITCYWRKSVLSTVKDLKAKTSDELCKRSTDFNEIDDSLLRAFIERGKESNKTAFVIRYSECRNYKTLYIDHLIIHYLEAHSENQFTCDNFLAWCSREMTTNLCNKVFNETMDQSTKSEWYYQRYARITASKLFECSNCATPDGSLVATIMGARGFKGNKATKRGQKLESQVFQLLQKKYPSIKKCGIILKCELPFFGASPDGIAGDIVFEIKCPTTEKTVTHYVDKGVLKSKVYFQMQLQLFMSNRNKGILVIADPNFEERDYSHILT